MVIKLITDPTQDGLQLNEIKHPRIVGKGPADFSRDLIAVTMKKLAFTTIGGKVRGIKLDSFNFYLKRISVLHLKPRWRLLQEIQLRSYF